jgi:hypothetical protein
MHGVIYGLHDPLTGELRYVGQTTTTVDSRLSAHLSPSNLRKHSYLCRWLGGLVKRGLRPGVSIRAEAVDQARLDCLEIEHIAAERKKGTRLVNQADGGGGRFGYVPSAEEREKIRRSNLGKKKPPHTDTWKRRMSELMTGRPSPNTKEHHKRLAAAKRGVPRSEETKAKIRAAKLGTKLSAAHRAAISAAHIRRDISTEEIQRRLAAGVSKAQIARDMGISLSLISNRLAHVLACSS